MRDIKAVNWVEVDLDAVKRNYIGIKEHLPKGVKICMVIKSNAYGHGAVQLARLYEELGADFVAVARTQEAVELRKHGIKLPILNLGYTDEFSYEVSVENDVSMTIYTVEMARDIDKIAASLGKKAKVHIKLDTGMSRLGFLVYDQFLEKSMEEIVEISKFDNIIIEGTFSHFANADDKVKEFERIQFARFKNAVKELENRGIKPEYVHCSNSAEILDTHEEFNMVRPGIIQYGIFPSDEVNKNIVLEEVMTFKARVSNVKVLNPGTSISYGRKYFTTAKEKIISLAIGYADGYLRGRYEPYVTYKGNNYSVVGRICMDQCMVRVPMDLDIHIGDEVIVFGNGGPSVTEVAKSCGTIEHEVLCNMNRRVPRVYIKDGKVVEVVDYLDY